MKKIFTALLICTSLCSFSQEKELEFFRKELTAFVNYDTGKAGSLPKTEVNTATLKRNMENAFLKFVVHKDSKDLETLKKNGKNDGKMTYWFDNYTYSFSELRRDMLQKTKENNIDYLISFSGLYDYGLSNFVSFFIQPFQMGNDSYTVYYFKLNGAGKYFIKNTNNNKIVYTGEAVTSGPAIRMLRPIDDSHTLVLEDMGDEGQRALVLKKVKSLFEPVQAFKGKAFLTPGNLTEKTFQEKRLYLRLASTKTINSHLSYFESKKNLLAFDEKSKTLSYSVSKDNSKTIQSKWENNMFSIDDYYLGEYLSDQTLPYPGGN